MARLGSSPQASTLSPCFSTTASNLSAMPLTPLGAGLPLLYRGFAGVQIARPFKRMAVNLEYSAAAFAKYQSGGVPVITDSPVKREKSLS